MRSTRADRRGAKLKTVDTDGLFSRTAVDRLIVPVNWQGQHSMHTPYGIASRRLRRPRGGMISATGTLRRHAITRIVRLLRRRRYMTHALDQRLFVPVIVGTRDCYTESRIKGAPTKPPINSGLRLETTTRELH